jgi:hypothetical protein
MGTRNFGRAASWTLGLLAVAGAAGCFLSKEEEVDSSPNDVTSAGDVSAVLKSTLILKSGCTATKIGPKHLLIAARCVVGSDVLVAGKTLEYTAASAGGSSVAPENLKDGGADAEKTTTTTSDEAGAPKDGGASADAGDAGKSTTSGTHAAVISEVRIHPSFTAKCKKDSCGFGTVEASDAPDIAVILLEEELETVPSLPVDLDPVGDADPLLVVSSGCASFDQKTGAKIKTTKAIAVPSLAVLHKGSGYVKSPQLVSRVGTGYVVTAGSDWQPTAPKLCMGDIGAPIFRGGSAAVAGVTSNFTTRDGKTVPVTMEHTRVDATSRFKIGTWLDEMGALTIHSCSESSAGCPKNVYTGSLPDGTKGESSGLDAGGDASAADGGEATDPSANTDSPLPADEGDGQLGDGTGDGTGDGLPDSGAPKKKKVTKGGCSAAPGELPTGSSMALGLGLGLAAIVARRRRR